MSLNQEKGGGITFVSNEPVLQQDGEGVWG